MTRPDISAIKARSGVCEANQSRADVRALCDRVEELEAALRVALGLYTNPDAESETGYAQYRMCCDILDGSGNASQTSKDALGATKP